MNNDVVTALYIHIPFCKHICSYCDFCKMLYNKQYIAKYLASLKLEVIKNYQHDQITTIYIGGGSPSALDLEELKELFTIINLIDTSQLKEFTFEMNVNEISEEKLIFLKNNLVNRISIGIETINNKFLSLMEREGNYKDVFNKIKLVKKYFDNINVDFMYGFCNETKKDLKKDLDFFKKLDVKHLSIYSLILEEHTKLFINKIKPLDADLEADMYYDIIDYLQKLGYKHYEISNFAKDGYQSIHNLTYWNNEQYYGFGLGASGYIGNIRYTNTKSINNYLKGNYRLIEDKINNEVVMENEMILGLRKRQGVDKKLFFKKYKQKIEDVFPIAKLIANKLLLEEGDYIYINPDKLYLSNSILVNFIKND